MKADLKKLVLNPDNPRIIKDHKFKQLVKSLKEFPEMSTVRPIVVNKDLVILGGNMRYRAMIEAGWKDAPIEIVDWTPEKQREFIIKDNVGFGEWDWEAIANEWPEVEEWGLDVPNWSEGHDANSMTDDDVNIEQEFDPYGIASNMFKVVFIFDTEIAAKEWLDKEHKGIEYKSYAGKIFQVNLSSVYGQ